MATAKMGTKWVPGKERVDQILAATHYTEGVIFFRFILLFI